jgi:hypothetical protein
MGEPIGGRYRPNRRRRVDAAASDGHMNHTLHFGFVDDTLCSYECHDLSCFESWARPQT